MNIELSTRGSLAGALAAILMACTAGEDPAGGGGQGGAGAAGSPTTDDTTSTSSGMGGTGGAPQHSLCGDGVRDGGEQCDGDDLGGATCASLGLGPGELSCAQGCGLITAGCALAEICGDHLDNNLDGLIDCNDPVCAASAVCESGCAQAQPIYVSDQTIGDYEFHGSTLGKPSGISPSCAVDSGAEEVITFVAPRTAQYVVIVGRWGSSADFSLSIRTDCDDAASEILCSDRPNVFTAGASERLVLDATLGSTYFVVVDTREGSPEGLFVLNVVPITPDTFGAEADGCGDGIDNDGNGKSDCNDPACAASPECVPGALPFGAGCSLATECASLDDRPVCSGPFVSGGLPGYCSRFCEVDAPDCSAGDFCAPLGNGEGICLDGCVSDADCLPGWGCREAGAPTPLCTTLESDCAASSSDNDGDGLEDCMDPDCDGTPECTPGTLVTGAFCTAHDECAAASGRPWCLFNFCTAQCDPTDAGACGPDALCVGHTFLGFLCYHKCADDQDCPDQDNGYCVDLPPGYDYGGVCNLPG